MNFQRPLADCMQESIKEAGGEPSTDEATKANEAIDKAKEALRESA